MRLRPTPGVRRAVHRHTGSQDRARSSCVYCNSPKHGQLIFVRTSTHSSGCLSDVHQPVWDSNPLHPTEDCPYFGTGEALSVAGRGRRAGKMQTAAGKEDVGFSWARRTLREGLKTLACRAGTLPHIDSLCSGLHVYWLNVINQENEDTASSAGLGPQYQRLNWIGPREGRRVRSDSLSWNSPNLVNGLSAR